MAELRIPLPKNSGANVPSNISFRWCAELHKALQPLLQYKLTDGSDAVIAHIAFCPERTIFLAHPWVTKNDRGGIVFGDPKTVALVELRNANFCTIAGIWFSIDDFANGADVAKEKFAQIIQHLEEHAVPQIAPRWISKALSTLNGK